MDILLACLHSKWMNEIKKNPFDDGCMHNYRTSRWLSVLLLELPSSCPASSKQCVPVVRDVVIDSQEFGIDELKSNSSKRTVHSTYLRYWNVQLWLSRFASSLPRSRPSSSNPWWTSSTFWPFFPTLSASPSTTQRTLETSRKSDELLNFSESCEY